MYQILYVSGRILGAQPLVTIIYARGRILGAQPLVK